MENKDKLEMPEDFTLEKSSKKLSRVNRTIPCSTCDTPKILNPNQYQSRYDYWGSEEKLKKHFICKECDMEMKTNPIKFWYKRGEILQELCKHVKIAFDLFNNSQKAQNDLTAMQNMVLFHTNQMFLETTNVEFVARMNDNLPEFHALKLHKIPNVGTITLKVYENKTDRIFVD